MFLEIFTIQKKRKNRVLSKEMHWKCAYVYNLSTTTLSKWNIFLTYIICLITLTWYKYLNLIFLDTFSDHLLLILSKSKKNKIVSTCHDIMHESYILWWILQKKIIWKTQWNLISKILSKCLHNIFQYEEMIHQNNEPPLISIHLRSPNL